MNDKLNKRRVELNDTFDQIVKKLQELETQKNELVGNANAIKGAIALVDELLAANPAVDEKAACECKVVPISQ